MSKKIRVLVPKNKNKLPDWYKKLVKENRVPWYQRLHSHWRVLARRVHIEFKKEDCWIGVYWEHEWMTYRGNPDKRERLFTSLYICIIPCLPIKITFL